MPQHSVQHLATGVTPAEIQAAQLAFVQAGPCITVEIHVPDVLAKKLQTAGQPVPPPITGKALFDTGASVSGMDAQHAQTLGLSPTGPIQLSTPHGSKPGSVYVVKLEFPGAPLPLIPVWFVAGIEVKSQGIDLIIGRDYLNDKVLIYNGPLRLYTLCY